jgi:hypothetical protein
MGHTAPVLQIMPAGFLDSPVDVREFLFLSLDQCLLGAQRIYVPAAGSQLVRDLGYVGFPLVCDGVGRAEVFQFVAKQDQPQ